MARRLDAVRHVLDEGSVDLDLVERETAQIAERRIAGAEIVHRDPHAELAQLVQGRQRRVGVLQQHRLGDLELQPLGAQAGGRQRARDHLHQIAAA